MEPAGLDKVPRLVGRLERLLGMADERVLFKVIGISESTLY